MFRSATLKLTFWYLVILMILSASFSLFFYRIGSYELDRGLRRPAVVFSPFTDDLSGSDQLRAQRLTEGEVHLQGELILFNLAILFLGGAASYALARRTLRPIESAMDAQVRFTADASHELRTPLAAMQSETEVALRDPKFSKEAAQKVLVSNLEEIAKLKALSDGLLRLAQNGEGEIPMGDVDLPDVVAESMNRLELPAKQQKVKIENQVGQVTVRGDRESLVELLSILLDNAIKYSEPGGKIELGARRHGKQAELFVRDSGQGIAAEDLPHIFDRLYRADSSRSKQRVKGYGLGLSIARRIAELHHGSIDVKSLAGKGATFTLRLPLPAPSRSLRLSKAGKKAKGR